MLVRKQYRRNGGRKAGRRGGEGGAGRCLQHRLSVYVLGKRAGVDSKRH